MPRSFKPQASALNLSALRLSAKDPRVVVRAALGLLLLANVIAALLTFKPWGGSAEQLAARQESLRTQLLQAQNHLNSAKNMVEKVQTARVAGDKFLNQYTTDRRTTMSTILSELDHAANEAGMKRREQSNVLEAVEGSDTLAQMTITAGYEGPYQNLVKFVNLLDKSPRFLIVESLQAAPQQAGGTLSVSVRMDAFVRDAMAAQEGL